MESEALWLLQMLQCLDVPNRQILYVNVVAYTSTIRGIVITAPDTEFVAFADGDLCDEGHQIIRRALRIFADQATFVRAYRIEVAKQRDACIGLSDMQITQNVFHHEFTATVRAGRREWMIFTVGQELRDAIHRCGGTEDNCLHACGMHGF